MGNIFKLVENVGLFNDYENTIDFLTKAQQTTFWNNKVKQGFLLSGDNTKYITNNSFLLNCNYNSVKDFSYCYFENDINGEIKRTYAFILAVDMINQGTAKFTYEIDVMQTYMFDYEFKESFIDREHQDRFTLSGTNIIPQFSTTKENLDYGEDYELAQSFDMIQDKNAGLKIAWVIFVCKNKLGDINYHNDLNPFNYYTLPIVLGSNTIGNYNFTAKSADIYNVTTTTVLTDVLEFYQMIKETSNVISVSIVNSLNIYYNITSVQDRQVEINVGRAPKLDVETVTISGTTCNVFYIWGMSNYTYSLYNTIKTLKLWQYSNNALQDGITPTQKALINKNSNVEDIPYYLEEPKILTNPYCYFNFSDLKTEGVILKNELAKNNDLAIKFLQSIEPNFKLKYWIEGYKNENGNSNPLIINQVNDLPLTTTAWTDYYSQNKSSLTTGNAVNIGSGIVKLGVGALTGGIGLVAGAMSSISQITDIANTLVKQSDIKQSPDNIKDLGNDALFDFNNGVYLTLKRYEITENFKNMLIKFFRHFGYKCNDFKIPNLKSRYYYNFIKTLKCNIVANINNETLNKIKQVFDKGITFWHYRNVDDFRFLDYTKENVEMMLVGG